MSFTDEIFMSFMCEIVFLVKCVQIFRNLHLVFKEKCYKCTIKDKWAIYNTYVCENTS